MTSDGQENIQPAWSPDGRYLAYVASQHGGIRIIPVSGGPARYLTDSGDSPQWSPDGRTLAIRDLNRRLSPAAETIPPAFGSILELINVDGGPASWLTSKEGAPFNPSSPRWLGDGRHIVFDSASPQSRTGLWIVDLVSRKSNSIRAGASPRFPIFSPDGRDLYFADEGARISGIWHARTTRDWNIESTEPLIPTEGSNPRYLTISSDGLRLAFSRVNGDSSIWSVLVDSHGAGVGSPRPLFRDRSLRNTNAHFSADGSRIVWTSEQPDNTAVIYVANSDGSSPVVVTPADQRSDEPQWVGKELMLAYRVRRKGENSYWVGAPGGRPERIGPALDLEQSRNLRVSPDGTTLLAHVTTPHGLQVVAGGLRGGTIRALTPADRNIGFPCWSPDGRWVAAEERIKGVTTLVVLPSGGGEIRTLGREFTQYYPFDWSPDGDRIAFAGLRNGVWNIYWISFSTGKVEQLTQFTTQSGFVRYPSWSPKGDQIVFERNDLTANIYVADLR